MPRCTKCLAVAIHCPGSTVSNPHSIRTIQYDAIRKAHCLNSAQHTESQFGHLPQHCAPITVELHCMTLDYAVHFGPLPLPPPGRCMTLPSEAPRAPLHYSLHVPLLYTGLYEEPPTLHFDLHNAFCCRFDFCSGTGLHRHYTALVQYGSSSILHFTGHCVIFSMTPCGCTVFVKPPLRLVPACPA